MRNAGFTLLELSIVIVIIGLIVAGISAGQSLVQQAKMRTIPAEIAQFKIAINSFKLQYDGLPGDLSNAHDYWDDGADGVCGTAVQCNGNGNGFVTLGTPVTDTESFRAWQHLSLAGLVNRTFTGVGTVNGTADNADRDQLYYSDFGRGKYYFNSLGNNFAVEANSFLLGGIAVIDAPNYGAFTVSEAYQIDKKVDDGVANAGKIFALDGVFAGAGDCSASRHSAGGADFNISNLSDDTNYCFFSIFYE